MKYLAILKDSFREAIDTKVFYVMVGLSALLTVLVLGVSFTPRPAKDLMGSMALTLNLDIDELLAEQKKLLAERAEGRRGANNPAELFRRLKPQGAAYEVRAVEPADGAADKPSSPLLWTVRAQYKMPAEAEQVRKDLAPAREFFEKRFGAIGGMRIFDVTDVRLAGPENTSASKEPGETEVFFEVQTKPTWATVRVWQHEPSLLFGAVPLRFEAGENWPPPLGVQLLFIQELFVNSIGATITLLVSIVLTAFFIPNMLRKGTVDLLLVKPISRWALLLYKYTGGLTFIFLNTTLAVGGVWLALGLRSGVWCNAFLLTIPVLTFAFAILYAVSTLFAVLTRSAIVAILAACFTWGVLYAVGTAHQVFDQIRIVEQLRNTPQEERISDTWYAQSIHGVHRVLPRYRDLVLLTSQLSQYDLIPLSKQLEREIDVKPVNWQESLGVSCGFIAIMLGLACWWFSTKDY